MLNHTGHTAGKEISPVLNKVDVSIINTTTVNQGRWFNNPITDQMLAAGTQTEIKNTCYVRKRMGEMNLPFI